MAKNICEQDLNKFFNVIIYFKNNSKNFEHN